MEGARRPATRLEIDADKSEFNSHKNMKKRNIVSLLMLLVSVVCFFLCKVLSSIFIEVVWRDKFNIAILMFFLFIGGLILLALSIMRLLK